MASALTPREDSFDTGSVSSLDLPELPAASTYQKGRFLVTLFPKAERFQRGRFKVTLFHCHKPTPVEPPSPSPPEPPCPLPTQPQSSESPASPSFSPSTATVHKQKKGIKTLFCCARPRSRSFDQANDQDDSSPLAIAQKLDRHSLSTLLLSSVDDQPTHPDTQRSTPYQSPLSSFKETTLRSISICETPKRSQIPGRGCSQSSIGSLSQVSEHNFRISHDSTISKFPSTALSSTSQDFYQASLQHTSSHLSSQLSSAQHISQLGSANLSPQLSSTQYSSQLSSQLSVPRPYPPALTLGSELGYHNRCGSEPLMAPSSPVDSVSSFAHRASMQHSMSTPDVAALNRRLNQDQTRLKPPAIETVVLCSNTDGPSVAVKKKSIQPHCLNFGRHHHTSLLSTRFQQQVETKGRFKVITTTRSGSGLGSVDVNTPTTLPGTEAPTPQCSTLVTPTPTVLKRGRFTVYESC